LQHIDQIFPASGVPLNPLPVLRLSATQVNDLGTRPDFSNVVLQCRIQAYYAMREFSTTFAFRTPLLPDFVPLTEANKQSLAMSGDLIGYVRSSSDILGYIFDKGQELEELYVQPTSPYN
jgi:hypothetical protein